MKSLLRSLVIAVAFPAAAWAQNAVTVTPSLSIVALSDSNVLSTPRAPQSDIVQRMTPALQLEARSRLWTVDTGFTLDAERYDRHPQLNDATARHQATAHLERTGRTVTFSTDAMYLATNAVQEINLQTGPGLNVQRGPATNVSAAPTVLAWLSPRTSVTAGGSFARTAYQNMRPDGPVPASILSWGGTAGVGRRVSKAGVVHLQFQERRFDFRDGDAASTARASGFRAVMGGWTHGEALATSISILGGPRLSGGLVRPEVAVTVRHRIRAGEFALLAASTEQAAVGEAGTVEVQRLTAHVTVRPARRLELRFEPGAGHQSVRTSGLRADTYLFNTAGTATIASWLSLEASFRGVWQRGVLPLVGPLDYDRRIVMVRAIVPGLRLRDTLGRPTPQR